MRDARLRQKRRQLLECHHSLGPAASDKTRRKATHLGPRLFSSLPRFGNCARTFPWPACARFAAGMGQLHPGHASLFMNKTDDSTQHLDVFVGPDAEV